MPRHAYCIIAHNEPSLLQKLIDLIDDHRNDIYILYDKKTDIRNFECIKAYKSLISLLPRIDIRWGDISQVDAELTILEAVVNSKREYSYLHLISGVDLPLKTQDYIHDFFERLPHGTNMLELSNDEANLNTLSKRTDYYHLFTNQYKQSNAVLRLMFSIIRLVSLEAQRLTGFKREWKGLTLAKGPNWGSLTIEFARYLVSKKDFILKRFRGVPCADECYKQTMAMSSNFCKTLSMDAGRKIDWKRGGPYVWRDCDYEELMNSSALFARKFSSDISKGLIEKIYDNLLGSALFSGFLT